MNKLIIRKFVQNDLDIVVNFISELYLEHDKKDPQLYKSSNNIIELKDWILSNSKNVNQQILIAEINSEVVGTIRCEIRNGEDYHVHNKYAYTTDLFVKKEFRNKGVASALKLEVENWVKSNNIKIIRSEINFWNEPSANLSKKIGYKPEFVTYYKILE